MITIGLAGEVHAAGGLPIHGAVPSAIVALAENQHVTVAVPREGALVEDELVPADGGSHGTGIDLGHASDNVRGRRQSLVVNIGHPNGDALLGIARSIGGIPAEAGHRGGGHTGLGQLSGEIEVLGNAIIIQGVEGEVARGRGTFTNLNLKRSTGSTAASTVKASVVVGSHGAAFTVEALSIESHLAVRGILINMGVDDHVGSHRELVDGIHAFRNLGERQGVVVVQHGRSDGRRHTLIAEAIGNSTEVVSRFNHIRDGRVVHFDHERPNVSGAVAFGDGNELTLDDTSLGSVGTHDEVDIRGSAHNEGKFLTFDAEQTIARGEIENGHRVLTAFSVHREVEGFHPCTDRANTKVQAVNDFGFTIHVLHMELVGR